jgi:hypothetical protein
VGTLTGAPDLSGWTVVERLVGDLGQLEEPVWLAYADVDDAAREALGVSAAGAVA